MIIVRPLLSAMMALGIAAPASAVTFTVTSTPFTAGAPTGHVLMCGPTDPACRDRWSGNYDIVSTNIINRHLVPSGWVGEYAAVPAPHNAPGGTATLSLAGVGTIKSWSFLWGSAGRFNVLQLFHTGSGSPFVVNGTHVISTDPAETATQRINRWVTITGDVPFTATMARFTHPSYAFESTAFGISPVPEPSSWAMLVLGFGLMGVTMRRRRRTRTVAA